jgi:hypothetical protein
LLTGPSASISGTYRTFTTLAGRGFALIDSATRAISEGSRAGARFARANVALYIESVYDAHYALAQIGKKVGAGYRKLGGSVAFAGVLEASEVQQLEKFYSEENCHLRPHAGVKIGS